VLPLTQYDEEDEREECASKRLSLFILGITLLLIDAIIIVYLGPADYPHTQTWDLQNDIYDIGMIA
jgi:hypothetical protein